MSEEQKGNAQVELKKLSMHFGSIVAVDDINLRIERGEFVTLLGPSGSGKTTTLSLVAGFMEPTSGRVFMGGRDITDVAPNRRAIGVVFQSYALFPHMSVAQNVAFPLRMRRISAPVIRERIRRVLGMVRLGELADRMPSMISGGQQQRVALARALVFEPPLLLMDEPLASLDRALREELQDELREIQKRLRQTVLYVTHDQEEALKISDRMAVMRAGRLEQVGTPREVYDNPQSSYVASFIGKTNFLSGDLIGREGEEILLRVSDGSVLRARAPKAEFAQGRVTVAIRPENMSFNSYGADEVNRGVGEIVDATYLGSEVRWRLRVWGTTIVVRGAPGSSGAIGQGDKVRVSWSSRNVAGIYEGEAPLGETETQ